MDIRHVAPGFAVAPQIQPGDLPDCAARGYAALICNRPDGEETGQPDADTMREAAQAVGIAFHHIPVSGGEFPAAAIDAFHAVRKGTQGPVLAFCRTGTRSITLETLANPDSLDRLTLLSRAQGAGYDLSGIAGRIADTTEHRERTP